jgi:peroxiredoxin
LTKQRINKVTSTKKIAVGSVAPNFKAIDGKGRIFDVQDFGGQYMVVYFWASWCEPCLRESPTLVKLYDKYKNEGFTTLSVSIDTRWILASEKDGYYKAKHFGAKWVYLIGCYLVVP